MPLNWYYSTNLESFVFFLKLKIDFENQILALFDGYFLPFNNSHEKIKSIFVISAIIPSIWNVFIKFRWHDEKLTNVHGITRLLKETVSVYYLFHCNQFLSSTYVKVEKSQNKFSIWSHPPKTQPNSLTK